MPSASCTFAQLSAYSSGLANLASSSKLPASTQSSCSLSFASMHACCRDLVTERYASLSTVYLPMRVIFTTSTRLSHLSARFMRQRDVSSLSLPVRASFLQITWCAPCDSSSNGTRQMFLTSCMVSTFSVGTWQNRASFSLTDCSMGSWQRHANSVGLRPNERSTCTLCCVGLVFCSPTTPITGTNETCTLQRLSGPTRNWNWRSASMNGMDSMSPTVPPSSMTHTSGAPSWPSTGKFATRWIQSWMASVMCGTTCTVLPK
mmetsp:Transcript_17645/g.30260  ORF Transcript_17645/g.30260 Transcript_17645/m.30260 type:complete len:261 (+) Transcript_17645:996-1778(+)